MTMKKNRNLNLLQEGQVLLMHVGEMLHVQWLYLDCGILLYIHVQLTFCKLSYIKLSCGGGAVG